MNMWFNLICAVLICVSAGCGFFKKKPPQSKDINRLQVSYKIVDPVRLKQGGNILLIPLYAGEGVEATDKLERFSLMMIKGATELIDDDPSALRVLSSQKAQDADLLLEGQILKFDKPAGVQGLLPVQRKTHIKLEGDLREKTTKNILVHFHFDKVISHRESLEKVAYQIGQDLGRLILTSAQNTPENE